MTGYVAFTGTETTCQSCNVGYTHVASCTYNVENGPTPVTCESGYFLESTEVTEDGVTTTDLECVSCNEYSNGLNVA